MARIARAVLGLLLVVAIAWLVNDNRTLRAENRLLKSRAESVESEAPSNAGRPIGVRSEAERIRRAAELNAQAMDEADVLSHMLTGKHLDAGATKQRPRKPAARADRSPAPSAR